MSEVKKDKPILPVRFHILSPAEYMSFFMKPIARHNNENTSIYALTPCVPIPTFRHNQTCSDSIALPISLSDWLKDTLLFSPARAILAMQNQRTSLLRPFRLARHRGAVKAAKPVSRSRVRQRAVLPLKIIADELQTGVAGNGKSVLGKRMIEPDSKLSKFTRVRYVCNKICRSVYLNHVIYRVIKLFCSSMSKFKEQRTI